MWQASLETKLTGLQTCGDKIDAAIVAFPGEKDRMLEESGSKMQELTSAVSSASRVAIILYQRTDASRACAAVC